MGVLVMMIAASDADAAVVEVQLGCSRTSALPAGPKGLLPTFGSSRFLHHLQHIVQTSQQRTMYSDRAMTEGRTQWHCQAQRCILAPLW